MIRWETPPSRIRTPEQSFETIRPARPANNRRSSRQSIGANEAAYVSNTPLVVRFDEEQIRSNEAEASKREKRMDDVDLDSCPPTPNTDDTPYIRFAIDQLTRDEEVGAQRPSAASSESYPVDRIIPDYGLGYMAPADREREALRLVRKHRSSPGEGRLFNFNATRPLSYHSEAAEPAAPIDHRMPEIFIPVDPPVNQLRYPDLKFLPTILRPTSLFILSFLCLLMTAALIFCGIFSTKHHGLANWQSGIYGGRYFVFGFLPQILAASIFLYVQGVVAALTRIMPYTLMAMNESERRTNALFLGIFPRTMLWPSLEGPIGIKAANVFLWLTVFTIPLQSCMFSVRRFDGTWRWTAVQGVCWTLVAIYILVLVATVFLALFFFRRTTGLMWDPRSLADMIALLPRSNSLKDYPGTDVMSSKEDIMRKLAMRSDRLGYWRTQNRSQAIFYCVGEEGTGTRRYAMEGGKIIHEKKPVVEEDSDVEKAAEMYSTRTRFRYTPWFLRDTFVIFWAVAAFIFLVALFIISFLPSTAIRKGFPPQVFVAPDYQGFSAANFLYSFIPAVLGMLLYLFFQSLDMAMRQLLPWAELSNPDGATAEESLLLDYTACLPIQCTIRAMTASHYRIAILSLLSFVFIVIPVLAGGIFFPLTPPGDDVRMIPNLPSYYIVLTLLIIYLLGLLLLIPYKRDMQLPHAVDCLAEIFSFVYGSAILDDAAFSAPRTKADLVTRLMATKVRGGVNLFVFGVYRGRFGNECFGIERTGRRGVQEVMVLSGR